MESNSEKKLILDLTGAGEVAKAIPEEVYIKSTDTLLKNFNDLISPITETTSGLGRYIKQKFDNMVEVEKSLLSYTIERSVLKAEKKAKILGKSIKTPEHVKSFVSSLEEASKETNEVLHLMWENIIANQLIDYKFHPYYVKVLSNFSDKEAQLLISLNSFEDIGENISSYYYYNVDKFKYYLKDSLTIELIPWTYSCELLLSFGFVDVLGLTGDLQDTIKDKNASILYRTKAGNNFLEAISYSNSKVQ